MLDNFIVLQTISKAKLNGEKSASQGHYVPLEERFALGLRQERNLPVIFVIEKIFASNLQPQTSNLRPPASNL